MAAPTAIAVFLDLDEYSKFEVDRRTMTVTWTATGSSMAGEQLTVELRKARRQRDIVVYTTTATITGSGSEESGTVSIDLLEDVVDSDSINLLRRGRYYVRVTSVTDDNIFGDSPDVPVSIVSARILRETYLFGLTLEANDIRDVKLPPTNVTGVEIEEVSSAHVQGFANLQYIAQASSGVRQLGWGGGPLVSITAPGRYLLRYGCSNGADYIIVVVRNLNSLPTTNKVDQLLVTKAEISDAMLQRWINQATDWIENDKLAGVFLEPTRVVTDPVLPGNVIPDWDFIVPPITFFPTMPSKWIDILFPYMGMLKVDELFGQIADTRIVDIDLSWIEIAERNGFAQLVPFNQEAAFNFIGLVWVESLRGRIELPNFWHFNAVAGLRQVDPVLQEIIAKKAAIDALTVAGQAFRGGFSSQSLSRDGVSESVSYTASAIYGIYSATIEDFNKFINREIKQVKGRYRGVNMIVL
jgi:hypothetical protein